MSNLGKPGCKECRVRPGGKVRVKDDGSCVGCGEPVRSVSIVPEHPLPIRSATDKPWRPGDAASPAPFAAILLLVALVSGCATRGDVAKLRKEIGAVAKECVNMRWDAINRNADTVRMVNVLENRIKAMEFEFGESWDNPDCEHYKPEAQKLFCKRISRAPLTQDDFDRLAEEAARKTDAEFCAKATGDWQRKAFCRPLPKPSILERDK